MIRLFMSTSCAALLISFQANAVTVTIGNGAVFPASGQFGGQVQAGRNGNGSVTINGGDVVTIDSGTSTDELVSRPKIDVGENGTGTVTVTGNGTTVNLNGTSSGSKLEVGTFAGSSGTLEVLNGATINLTDDGPLSGDDDENIFLQFGEDQATGTLTMNNGTINATGYSRVGMLVGVHGNTPIAGSGVIDLTNSTINMTNLGTSQLSFMVIGDQANGRGDVDLVNSQIIQSTPNQRAFFGLGTDSGNGDVSLMSSSNFLVSANKIDAVLGEGSGAVANFALDNTSTASFISTGAMDFEIGRSAGSTATISVKNGSQFNVAGAFGRVQIGSDSATTIAGSGSVNVNNSTFDSTVGIQVGSAFTGPNNQTGQLNLNNGTVNAPEVVVANGGSLTGTGTVNATKTRLAGGTIMPGLSPGILNFTGDLQIDSGLFLFEIGGTAPSLFDSIFVGGNLFATNSFDLEFRFVNGFVPTQTDTFNIFNAASIDPSFFSFANFISNAPVTLSSNGGAVGLSFTNVAAVPLPGGLPLMLMGLIGMGIASRRKVRT